MTDKQLDNLESDLEWKPTYSIWLKIWKVIKVYTIWAWYSSKFYKYVCIKFNRCYLHGFQYKVKRFRMNTAYVKDEANYCNGCSECQKEINEYWDERWKEYYSDCL